MKNNTAPRKTLTAVLAVAMAAGLTGCGSSLAANTNNYFTNVSSILHTLQTNGKQQAASPPLSPMMAVSWRPQRISPWTKAETTALPV